MCHAVVKPSEDFVVGIRGEVEVDFVGSETPHPKENIDEIELVDFGTQIVDFRGDFFELLLRGWLQLIIMPDDLGKATKHAQGEDNVLRLKESLVIRVNLEKRLRVLGCAYLGDQ